MPDSQVGQRARPKCVNPFSIKGREMIEQKYAEQGSGETLGRFCCPFCPELVISTGVGSGRKNGPASRAGICGSGRIEFAHMVCGGKLARPRPRSYGANLHVRGRAHTGVFQAVVIQGQLLKSGSSLEIIVAGDEAGAEANENSTQRSRR